MNKISADYSSLLPKKPAPDIAPSLRVGIVLTPNFTLMSLACFVEFLRLASDEQDFSRNIYCSWALLSHNREPVYASCGFAIQPTALYDDDDIEFDYIVVHGGTLHTGRDIPDALYDFVAQHHRNGTPLVGLCTGQFVLAELGLLNGHQCAVHFSLEDLMRQQFPEVTPVTDTSVVKDGPFYSCPGGLAAINLAATLVGENCGQTRVDKVLHFLMADPGAVERQTAMNSFNDMGINCVDRRVGRAVSLMHQQLYNTDSVASIASAVGTSERELTRLFKKHLDKPPGEYWREIRLKSAHWMVINTDRSMAQIAYECGFTDSSHLIRWFKRRYGETPRKLRNLRNDLSAL